MLKAVIRPFLLYHIMFVYLQYHDSVAKYSLYTHQQHEEWGSYNFV